ncbi:MAG: hypothetical protein LBK77_07635 [Spirochaetaceae bacterium]|jgi:hypothetical protein|nr:hypothetical protein [Spirochaetaceae bacterium]
MVCQTRKEILGKLRNCAAGLALCFLAGCASVPRPENYYAGRKDTFALMAPGAELYITAEVRSVRPILEKLFLAGMTGADLKEFLDMSDTLTAAVFDEAGPARHFYAAAAGRFPGVRGGIFFGASRDWEKRVSAAGIDYWHSEKSRLSVFMGTKNAYFSDGDPFVPAPGAQSPPALEGLRRGSVLSGWMENPSSAINRIIAAFGLPIEIPANRLVFGVYPAGDAGEGLEEYYTAVLRFETPTAAQAAALVRIFTMAKIGLETADFSGYRDMETLARAFFTENPVRDGNALVLTTGVMSGGDLALLFNVISLY